MAPQPVRVEPEAQWQIDERADNRMWRAETSKDIQRAILKEREACARIIDATYMEEAAAQIRARR